MRKRIVGVLSAILFVVAAPVVTPDVSATLREEPLCDGCIPAASWAFNDDYIFPVTRDLRDACGIPGLCALVLPVTFAADIALLPFGLVVGFAGE